MKNIKYIIFSLLVLIVFLFIGLSFIKKTPSNPLADSKKSANPAPDSKIEKNVDEYIVDSSDFLSPQTLISEIKKSELSTKEIDGLIQMREEEKALRELEKAKQDAEKEEQRYQDAINKAKKELHNKQGKELEELNAQLRLLEQQLAEENEKKEKYKIKLNYLSNIRELVERVSNSEKERDK